MKPIDRYLRSVKFFLPQAQQDDILAELSEDLHAQIDDLENERGRKLDDIEIASLLKKRGSPMLVAGSYLPQNHLIGPAFYPLYRFVLKLVVLWVQVPLFLLIIGPINVLTSTTPVAAIFQTLAQLLQAAFIAFGVITVIFALLEQPRLLNDRATVARRTSVTDLLNAAWLIGLWTYLVRFVPRLNLSGVHLELAPVWETLFWPVLALLICAAVLRVMGLVSGHERTLSLARLTINCAGLAITLFLLAAGSWVQIISTGLSAGTLATASKWANINAAVLILGTALAIAFAAYQEFRGLRTPPQTLRARPLTP